MDTEDGHNADLTRREVLSTAGAAGIVAGADALVGHGHAQAGKPPHVVIVGAGLAGTLRSARAAEKTLDLHDPGGRQAACGRSRPNREV